MNTPLEGLRDVMRRNGSFEDCLLDRKTLCPCRGCWGQVTDSLDVREMPSCDSGHDWYRICHAVGEEIAAESDEMAGKADNDEIPKDPHQRQTWMRRHIAESIVAGGPIDVEALNFERAKLAPRYPSAVEGLEVYGNTILLADAGVGKSLLSIGIALESASCGAWSVVYFNAELDKSELALRVQRYAEGMVNETQHEWVTWASCGDGTRIDELVSICIGRTPLKRKLLVIIDSINTFAEFAADTTAANDLMQTRRLYNWATQVRKRTLGEVSFVLVSETNASGGVKGRKGSFSADVVVRIAPLTGDQVEIDVLKSRSAQGGPLGRYVRNWKRGRFER